jgi:1-acyl-sn-glycerol-3-phosphate acyltransferase
MPDRPCIIAAKHQSAWDIFALSVLLDQPTFVLKKELMHIPFFGWFLRRYGAVPVDRKAGASALRGMLRRAKAEMARGRSVVIFPEGTRVPPGETRAYHPGVAALYRELDVPLVPVTLNSGWFWGRRKFRKKPGTIVVEFQPAIAPGLSRREVMARLSEALERDSRD